MKNINNRRKPDWLKIKLPNDEEYSKMNKIIKEHNLHTICTSGKCPNAGECWGLGTATFMILGDICTRSCKFCAVKTGKPLPLDKDEPMHIAESVKLLSLKHCVITSVDRDDLTDYGSDMWVETIKTIKKINPKTTMEVLIPDFMGDYASLKKIIDAKPEVISHNMETVKRLTPSVRSKAQYDRSLEVIKRISESGTISKSGIMLGIGETEEEILQTMDDLLNVGCKVFTIGQYLQPTKNNMPVTEYVTPETFKKYEEIGLKKGFKFVESSPLVRSSYHAAKHVNC
ncbi:MAG: lipoyl synthase [Bacteroidetes bacterium]|nr:lipoyl synthase [Bacteroidota bacterium]